MQITGTFLDEITHDIPSANWGPRQWAADFDAMRRVGIDTVILIRGGYKDKVAFDSKVISAEQAIMPVPFDLVELFLDQAQRCGMSLYFGTYDSGRYWHNGDHKKEVEINKAFAEEVVGRYGGHEAFNGWYISHEIERYNEAAVQVYIQLARHLKELKDIPTMISPYIRGKKQFSDEPFTLEDHRASWDEVFERVGGFIDIVAFQDGNVAFGELEDYIRVNHELAQRHGLVSWSNVESFDRDMPIKFPPIAWPKLLHKMQVAHKVGIDKLITFEFSHFMSPNSIYPSAHNLYERYIEWLGGGSVVRSSGGSKIAEVDGAGPGAFEQAIRDKIRSGEYEEA